MKDNVGNGNVVTPMLFRMNLKSFYNLWGKLSEKKCVVLKEKTVSPGDGTTVMTYKPLYKMTEICALLRVTKPTIWIGETWKAEAI